MATDLTVEQTIARPREEVARFTTDWRNDLEWIGALRDVRLVTEGEFGVGSQVLRVASFLGRRIGYVNEIAALEPGRRLVMRSVKAPFPMTVTYEWEDVPDGTLMRIRTQGDASGFYRVAGPLLDVAVRRGVGRDLARLRRLLESSLQTTADPPDG